MPIAAIALITLGFFAWWPLGLAALLFFLWSRKMCWHRYAMDGCGYPMTGWPSDMGQAHWDAKMQRLQGKMERMRAKMDNLGRGDWWGRPASSGNRAFDDYRQETLRRLEDEQREFKEFLQRLRFAKDREEFDQFMAERRNRPRDEGSQPQPQG
jgi:hypothetical protein